MVQSLKSGELEAKKKPFTMKDLLLIFNDQDSKEELSSNFRQKKATPSVQIIVLSCPNFYLVSTIDL